MSASAGVVPDLRALRRLLAEQYPDAQPLVERDRVNGAEGVAPRAGRFALPLSTGIGALDAVFPGGGLPRGKLTAWAPEGGAASLLRSACRAVLAAGERAAWVDATATRSAAWMAAWGASGGSRGVLHVPPPATPELIPLLVQARTRLDALRCAEYLLRSAAFALVVVDPPPGEPPQGTETVRLTRSARDGGAALVVLTERGSMAALRVASRLLLRGVRWRHGPFGPAAPVAVRAEVRARALGWHARVEVPLTVAAYDIRDALEPGRDRRGAGSDAGHNATSGGGLGIGLGSWPARPAAE